MKPNAAWQISIVSFAIVVSNGVAAGGSASGEANMLFGVVHSADGAPIADAFVVIETARPREGESVLAFVCYPDCLRSAVTDAEGKFSIANVDTRLVFDVHIATQGFETAIVAKADPQHGEIAVTLAARGSPK